jgi:transcriptional regulator with XRE-family HTH domain
MRFHEKLKRLCGERRLTQADFLREMPEVGKTTMYYWFTGRNKPDLDSALRMAKILNVPLDYLADEELEELPSPEFNDDERLLIEVARTLQGGAREALWRVTNNQTIAKGDWVVVGVGGQGKSSLLQRLATEDHPTSPATPPVATGQPWPPIAHQDLTQSTLRREREARRTETEAARKKAAEKGKKGERTSGKEK